MNKLERYNQLAREIKAHQTELDRADGALRQLMSQLKDEFGCKTIKDAKAKKKQLVQQQKQLDEEAERMADDFEKQFGDRIRNAK